MARRRPDPFAFIALAACVSLTACRDVIDLRTSTGVHRVPTTTTTTTNPPPASEGRYQVLLDDPLGDGAAAAAANLFLHEGLLVIGPSAAGDRAVRVDPVGEVRGVVSFAIDGDGANKASGTFASFGFPGCHPNTLECGPDNENTNALLTSAVIDGRDVLVASGGKGDGGGAIHDVYFGVVDGDVAHFAYLDFGAAAGNDASGVDVVHQDRLAGGGSLTLGLRVRGPGAPRLLEVLHAPTSGGASAQVSAHCDPARGDVCDLRAADHVTPLHAHDLDAASAAGSYTFLGAAGGIARVVGALADAQSTSAFTDVTPSSYASATSIDSTTAGPISSRAIVGFAAAGDDVVFGRNTTLGAQLWSCAGGANSGCAPEQWTLLAGIDDATNARVSAVWSTGTSALFAVDDPAGIRLYTYVPSTTPDTDAALVRLDGVDGLGTHVLASLVASLAEQTWLYALVADDTGPPRLVRVLLETPSTVDVSG